MKKLIIQHKNLVLKVNIDHNNTSIIDSYRVKSRTDMIDVLTKIRSEVDDSEMAINKRKIYGMVNEWRTHNLLYSLGIQRDRTKSVDLNTNQPWYVSLAYTVISPFYLHFS